jgi:putative hydrolase of HD superfamily
VALFTVALARILRLSIDLNRIASMLLVHEIGEIDARDKFPSSENGWTELKAAEPRAVERIFGIAALATAEFALSL